MWNWHVAAFGAAAVGAAVFALLYVRREIFHDRSSPAIVAPGALPAAQAPVESQFAFLGSAAVWLCFLFFLLTTAGFGILQTYAPTVLGHVYSMPLAFATAGLTAYLLGSAGGIVAGGFVAARFTETDWVIASMLAFAALVALVLAAAVVPAWLAIACMAGMGFGVGVAGPSRDLLVRKAATSQFGKTSYGRVYGFVYSGTDVGLALAPLVIGPVLDAGHFSLALYAVAALQVGAVIGALRVGAQTRVTAMSRAGAE
jgi:predicted MFS family arabinose efflux permease